MTKFVARSPIRIHGTDYKRGAEVPVHQLETELRKKLIDQRRVVADEPDRRGSGRKGG